MAPASNSPYIREHSYIDHVQRGRGREVNRGGVRIHGYRGRQSWFSYRGWGGGGGGRQLGKVTFTFVSCPWIQDGKNGKVFFLGVLAFLDPVKICTLERSAVNISYQIQR